MTNSTAPARELTRAFFDAATGHLLDAGKRAAVGHHVDLSILPVDEVEGNAHYVGKRRHARRSSR